MKTYILSLVLATLLFVACTNSTQKNPSAESSTAAATSVAGSKAGSTTASVSIGKLVDNYLQMKNAFTQDNDKAAAEAGNAMVTTFASFDKSTLNTEQARIFNEIEADAKEHAEHIGSNAGKIEHQREHFDMLSNDMTDLVKEFGAGRTVYLDHCPMYNNNKGANWLSETKEIANPYLGQSMPTCGTVKEELK
jgi:uncharacterized protein (DUF885 family)